jgi:hypothetical protein
MQKIVANSFANSLAKKLASKLTDWLIALFVASVLIWFTVTQPIFSFAQQDSAPEIDVKRLERHVSLLTNKYAPRTLDSAQLKKTAKYIANEFIGLGRVEYQTIETLAGNYQNVLLNLGADSKDIFVIGAHYDAENSSHETEGNASGVSALIELARHLSKNAEKLPLRVVLVAYPLSSNQSNRIETTGSYIHAKSLKDSGKEVRLMVSLDSVGIYNSDKQSQKHPYNFMKLFYPEQGNYINLTGRLTDFTEVRQLKRSFKRVSKLPLYSQSIPQNLLQSKSVDHQNYWKMGYAAVLMSDTAELRTKGEPKTERGRSLSKSTAKLEPEKMIDYEKIAMLVQGLYQVVMDSGEPANKPLIAEQRKGLSAEL